MPASTPHNAKAVNDALPSDITLDQFERIDALRADLYSATTNAARAESRLFDELIAVLGYQGANDIPDVGAYAAELIIACLTGRVGTIDREAA